MQPSCVGEYEGFNIILIMIRVLALQKHCFGRWPQGTLTIPRLFTCAGVAQKSLLDLLQRQTALCHVAGEVGELSGLVEPGPWHTGRSTGVPWTHPCLFWQSSFVADFTSSQIK